MNAVIFITSLLLAQTSPAQDHVRFERVKISDVTYEAASVFDVNRDNHLDIVSGEYWFEGPSFKVQHKICDVMPSGDYFDDFADYPMDVNGDGYIDIVTGAWFGKKISWRENPKGKPVLWTVHDIAQVGNVERPCFWDIDGDGHVEVVPNTPGSPQQILILERDASGNGTGHFRRHQISARSTGHGLGFGDINGDGRGDLVVSDGWFEAPENPFADEWNFHDAFNLGPGASVPIIVFDVNEDGANDLIVGNGHDYGLMWWEQQRTSDGGASWLIHEIDMTESQFHDLEFADLDKDGAKELITGKRWRAHSGNDPGADDDVGLYYFNINGGAFQRVTLNKGPATEVSGTGIYMWVEDITGNGWPDIIAPGKEGLYLFKNLGPK